MFVALTVEITCVVEELDDFDWPAETLAVGVMPVAPPMPTPTDTPMLAPADWLLDEASVVAWAPAMSILLAVIFTLPFIGSSA